MNTNILENTKFLVNFLDDKDYVLANVKGTKYLDRRIAKLETYHASENFFLAVQEYSILRKILN